MQTQTGRNLYTAYIAYTMDIERVDDPRKAIIEEIDVHADTLAEARQKAQAELEADYDPGLEIVHIEERVPEVQVWSI